MITNDEKLAIKRYHETLKNKILEADRNICESFNNAKEKDLNELISLLKDTVSPHLLKEFFKENGSFSFINNLSDGVFLDETGKATLLKNEEHLLYLMRRLSIFKNPEFKSIEENLKLGYEVMNRVVSEEFSSVDLKNMDFERDYFFKEMIVNYIEYIVDDEKLPYLSPNDIADWIIKSGDYSILKYNHNSSDFIEEFKRKNCEFFIASSLNSINSLIPEGTGFGSDLFVSNALFEKSIDSSNVNFPEIMHFKMNLDKETSFEFSIINSLNNNYVFIGPKKEALDALEDQKNFDWIDWRKENIIALDYYFVRTGDNTYFDLLTQEKVSKLIKKIKSDYTQTYYHKDGDTVVIDVTSKKYMDDIDPSGIEYVKKLKSEGDNLLLAYLIASGKTDKTNILEDFINEYSSPSFKP